MDFPWETIFRRKTFSVGGSTCMEGMAFRVFLQYWANITWKMYTAYFLEQCDVPPIFHEKSQRGKNGVDMLHSCLKAVIRRLSELGVSTGHLRISNK